MGSERTTDASPHGEILAREKVPKPHHHILRLSSRQHSNDLLHTVSAPQPAESAETHTASSNRHKFIPKPTTWRAMILSGPLLGPTLYVLPEDGGGSLDADRSSAPSSLNFVITRTKRSVVGIPGVRTACETYTDFIRQHLGNEK
jgi:hypothetical protein